MAVTTPILEAAMAAIAARLAAQIPTATVERARRAPVDTDNDTLPILLLDITGWTPDETVEPLVVHYTLEFTVTGHADAGGDTGDTQNLLAQQATIALQAQVTAALSGWTPATAGLGDVVEDAAEHRLFAADESAKPVGEVTARFTMLCTAPLGGPYVP